MRRVLFRIAAGMSMVPILFVLVTLGMAVLRGASSGGIGGAASEIASYFRYFLMPVVDAGISEPGIGAMVVVPLVLYVILMACLPQSRLEKRIAIGIVPLATLSLPIFGVLVVYLLQGPFIMSP